MVPPEIAPVATPSAPRHISRVIAPKTSKMTTAVITARIVMRRLAVPKVRSTAAEKRSASRLSWLKAWTIVQRAEHFGDQRADVGDPVLAGARDRAQPAAEQTIGRITTGIPATRPSVSFGARENR